VCVCLMTHLFSIGRNIKMLLERPDDPHCFRLHKERVFYISERVMKLATNIGKKELLSLGVCFGKFTKTKKFTLHMTCLDYLAQHATVWCTNYQPV
jgi:60S ribosome subunit biogenesis protein NIP7